MTINLHSPLPLPCGATLKNRFAKAAMTEGLADPCGIPGEDLNNLYGLWSDGGAALLLSGNIMVDSDHLERPGNIVIDSELNRELTDGLLALAKHATRNDNHFWAQLSHSGRQTPKNVNPSPKAPSAVKVNLPGGQFGMPMAMSDDEISDIITKFANAARTVKDAGFTGVQIHAAHGYLLSSFLSPLINLRDDKYGGSLENRARFLREVVAAVRSVVGKTFPVAVKLNSADFQRGGFQFEDSLQVAQWLANDGIDLLEISGGNYEQPKLLGLAGLEEEEPQNVAESTGQREAYFVDFAKAMQAQVTIPLMVTGGFRTAAAMDFAVDSGAADVIGIGRPMCTMSDAPEKLLNGLEKLPSPEKELGMFPSWLGFLRNIGMFRAMEGFAVQYWFYAQIYALAEKGQMDTQVTPFQAFRMVEARNKHLISERKRLVF